MTHHASASRRQAWIALCLALALQARGGEPGDFDWGPLGSRETDVSGTVRLKLLGPLFELRESPGGESLLAVRPFYSRETDPANDRVLRHFLWPLASVKDLRGERFWHCLTAYGNDYDIASADSAWKVVVSPVLFAGRDKAGEGYFAIAPFGGTIHDFFGQDRVAFVLFPLYLYSEVNDVKSRAFLWPLIESAKGKETRRFRVAPFYGRSVREGVREASFVMWPLWTETKWSSARGEAGRAYMLFPFFAHSRAGDCRTWMVLPPVFRLSVGRNRTAVNCPWPFVQYSEGDPSKLYVWPFWGRREQAGLTRTFWAWPFVYGERNERPEYVIRRFAVLPVADFESRAARGKGGAETGAPFARKARVWPLVSYHRQGAMSELRTLELWPTRDMKPVEKNLAPLWTLYTWSRNGAAREHEVLWGAYRYRSDGLGNVSRSIFPLYRSERSGPDGGRGRWELLGGLAGCNRDGLRRRYRLLYFINLGGGAAAGPAAAAPGLDAAPPGAGEESR